MNHPSNSHFADFCHISPGFYRTLAQDPYFASLHRLHNQGRLNQNNCGKYKNAEKSKDAVAYSDSTSSNVKAPQLEKAEVDGGIIQQMLGSSYKSKHFQEQQTTPPHQPKQGKGRDMYPWRFVTTLECYNPFDDEEMVEGVGIDVDTNLNIPKKVNDSPVCQLILPKKHKTKETNRNVMRLVKDSGVIEYREYAEEICIVTSKNKKSDRPPQDYDDPKRMEIYCCDEDVYNVELNASGADYLR
uniref:Spaetzle domain-containing protein n=1 Tax=Rhabditophanes sp. KR3021 TaxID=114890 RepID=A0AC35TI58_9BILA